MARARSPRGRSDSFPGIGLALGAGVGILAGVIVGGGFASVLGIVLGAGVGLVIGAAVSVQHGGRTR